MSTIIKHKEFTNHKVYKTEVAGRPPDHRRGQGGRAGHRFRHGHLRRDHRAGGRHRVPPAPRDGVDFFPPLRGL